MNLEEPANSCPGGEVIDIGHVSRQLVRLLKLVALALVVVVVIYFEWSWR